MAGVLKFGTDGWRGVIGDDFTFHNIIRIAEGLHRSGLANKVVVGYDHRFLAEEAAALAAAWLQHRGHQVWLSKSAIPSPAVSFYVVKTQANAGVMITASHNPHLYNGVKFKGPYGGSFTEEMVKSVTPHIPEQSPLIELNQDPLTFLRLHRAKLNLVDVRADYIEALLARLKLRSLAGLKVVVDPMHGSGASILSDALRRLGAEVTEIRGQRDPLFGGVHPEPLDATTALLRQTILQQRADLGLCVDGDADRIGARDEKGEFVDSHRIFSLLIKHLVDNRGLKGKVVKTISATDMINKLCERYQLPCTVTPVGFKHVCHLMLTEQVLIGGEESGGIGMPMHLPERDGALCGLLLCEMAIMTKRSMHQLVEDLMREVGEHHFSRLDVAVPPGQSLPIVAKIKAKPPSQFADLKVESVDLLDGIKFRLSQGWLMVRGSGTEPLLRIYCEAPSPKMVTAILDDAKSLALQFAE